MKISRQDLDRLFTTARFDHPARKSNALAEPKHRPKRGTFWQDGRPFRMRTSKVHFVQHDYGLPIVSRHKKAAMAAAEAEAKKNPKPKRRKRRRA